MSPFLMALLGQQAMPHGTYDQGIDVLGNPEAQGIPQTSAVNQQEQQPVPWDPVPQNNLQPNYLSSEQLRDMSPLSNTPAHKGMFGLKGNFRDIIGVLGDAFLLNAGAKPVYAPQREKERLSDSMAGFMQNPQDAIARVMAQDPEAGMEVYKQWQLDNYRGDTTDSNNQMRDVLNSQRQAKLLFDARNVAARLLGAAGNDPTKLQYAMRQIESISEQTGLGLDDLGLEESLTPEQAALYAQSDMTVQQQQKLPLDRRRLDIAQQNADANTKRANKPAQGRAATDRDVYMKLKDKDPDELSPGEQGFIRKYEQGTKKESRLGAPPPPPGGPQTKSRFRIIR